MFTAIFALAFSTSAFAEKIMCVDKKHQTHQVEFIGQSTDFVYVDNYEYSYYGESKDSKTIQYSNEKNDVIFIVDPDNRDWFFLVQRSKGKKQVDNFEALCDNVNVVVEDKLPQLVLNK